MPLKSRIVFKNLLLHYRVLRGPAPSNVEKLTAPHHPSLLLVPEPFPVEWTHSATRPHILLAKSNIGYWRREYHQQGEGTYEQPFISRKSLLVFVKDQIILLLFIFGRLP